MSRCDVDHLIESSMPISWPVLPVPIAVAFLVAIPLTGHAEVFKCPTAGGKVEYRDSPCPPGVTGTKVHVAPSPTPMERLYAKQLADRNAAELKASSVPPPSNAALTGMGKIIDGMKMNDIKRDDARRLGDKQR